MTGSLLTNKTPDLLDTAPFEADPSFTDNARIKRSLKVLTGKSRARLYTNGTALIAHPNGKLEFLSCDVWRYRVDFEAGFYPEMGSFKTQFQKMVERWASHEQFNNY